MRHPIQTVMVSITTATLISGDVFAATAGGARTGGSSDAAMVVSILVAIAVGFLVRNADSPFRPIPTAIVAGCLMNLLIS